MASGSRGAVLQQIQRLFQIGTASGLSEWQLLRRYLALRDESAFEALVARHGPMVLGVCRRILHDPRDVEDAFQATFLVLVRRASALGERDAIGPWLYGVAYRVSLRARAVRLKRSDRERLEPELEAPAPEVDPTLFELSALIDHELGRLPAKYRAPVVLCYLEGQTHEEAARRLGWPLGSVKGRLARARELLRTRLIRRGLVLSAGALAASLSRDLHAGVPELLCDSTVRAAIRFTTQRAVGVVPASVAALTEGVLRTMSMSKLSVVAASVLVTTGALVLAGQVADTKTKGSGVKEGAVSSPGSRPSAIKSADGEGKKSDQHLSLAELDNLRVGLADEDLRAQKAFYDEGRIPIARYAEASRRYAEVHLESSASRQDKISILKGHWNRMREVEKKENSGDAVRTDEDGNLANIREARVARIEAEWWLAKIETEAAEVRDAVSSPLSAKPTDERGQGASTRLNPGEKSHAVLAALDKPWPKTLDELKTPTLEALLKAIKVATESPELPTGIPIYVDPVGLQEVRGTMLSVIANMGGGNSVKADFSQGLQFLGLAYTVRDGMVVISSRNQVAFLELGMLRDEVKVLTEQVRTSTSPPAVATAANRAQAGAGSPVTKAARRANSGLDVSDEEEEAQTEAILSALNKVVPMHFQNATIEDIVKVIRTSSTGPRLPQGIPIYVDPASFAGMESAPTATIQLDGVRLKTSLRLLLNQMGLSYAVKEGLLMIVNVDSPELTTGRAGGMGGMGMGGMGGGMR